MESVTRLLDGTVSDWDAVLAHRGSESAIVVVRDRFLENGISSEVVAAVLQDGGESIFQAASSGRPDWTVPYGGLLAAALLAGEVAVYSSHLVARASAVRSVAVDSLLEDFSAVSVATDLGVSRQKVYEIARGGSKIREAISRERS